MQSLCPFWRWALDLIGKISPTSLGGQTFLITIIEYFTKWVEAIPMIFTKGIKIVEFIEYYTYVILVFLIVIGNWKNFKNKEVLALCKEYNIRISFSMPIILKGMVRLKP